MVTMEKKTEHSDEAKRQLCHFQQCGSYSEDRAGLPVTNPPHLALRFPIHFPTSDLSPYNITAMNQSGISSENVSVITLFALTTK